MKKTKTRINKFINVSEVFLIDAEGVSIGVCPTSQALQMAEDQDLDLVEVSPQARPPVCKLLNFGKYKYEMNKKGKNQKKKQMLKEIRMQPKISDHDLNFKTNHVQQFLEEGHKVKVTIRFRGRELSHTELGKVVLDRILAMLTCAYTVDKAPSMEGRMMTVMLSPTATTTSKKPESKPETENTSKPETGNIQKPQPENTKKPEVENTQKQETENTKKPEMENTQKPEMENTKKPETESVSTLPPQDTSIENRIMQNTCKIKTLQNKKCIITGAGSGLGRQVALQLYMQNVELVLIGRNKKKLEKTVKICKESNFNNSHKIHIISADVSSWNHTHKAIKESLVYLGGTIDIVFANAGQSMYAKIQECEVKVFEKMMSANYYTAVNVIQNALPYLQKSKGIVAATTSIQSIIGVPHHSAYVAAKHAMSGYLAALELECPNIGVVEIIPGWIRGTSLRNAALDGRGNKTKSRASHKTHSRSSISVEKCALAVLDALAEKKRYTYRPKLWQYIPFAKLFFRKTLHKKIISLQSYGTK